MHFLIGNNGYISFFVLKVKRVSKTKNDWITCFNNYYRFFFSDFSRSFFVSL